MTPNTLTPMPPKLNQAQLADLSRKERSDRNTQTAKAAVDLCRTNRDLFLKAYPALDLRNPK